MDDIISTAEKVTFENSQLGDLLGEFQGLNDSAIKTHLGQMQFRGSGIRTESAPKESGMPESEMQESGIQSTGGQRADVRASK